MGFRSLPSLAALLGLAALLRGGPLPMLRKDSDLRSAQQGTRPAGYLVLPEPADDGRPRLEPYYPHAGDILLFDDMIELHHLAFRVAGTGPPTHASIVVDRDDQPVILELTGPTCPRATVIFMDPLERLAGYPGTIMVRRLKQPLTPEQSADMTQFALAQEGKHIAMRRGLLQATPFCARTGLRRHLFGHTYFHRKRWFCSELVVAAAASAHILDPHVCLANATYPRDLAYDETYDLSPFYEKPLPWTAQR